MSEAPAEEWWAPIVRERISQNTIQDATWIRITYNDVRDIEPATIQYLLRRIKDNEIDPEQLHRLVWIDDTLPRFTEEPANTDLSFLLAELTELIVFTADEAEELSSQQDVSTIPDDSKDDQPVPDATSTTSPPKALTKCQIQNRKRKAKKRAAAAAAASQAAAAAGASSDSSKKHCADACCSHDHTH